MARKSAKKKLEDYMKRKAQEKSYEHEKRHTPK